jgi:hypothetical protein
MCLAATACAGVEPQASPPAHGDADLRDLRALEEARMLESPLIWCPPFDGPETFGTVVATTPGGDLFAISVDPTSHLTMAAGSQILVMGPNRCLKGIARIDEISCGRADCTLLEPPPWPRVVEAGDPVARTSKPSPWAPSLRGRIVEYRAADRLVLTDIPHNACGIRWRPGWSFVIYDQGDYFGDAVTCGEEGEGSSCACRFPCPRRGLRGRATDSRQSSTSEVGNATRAG